MPRRPHPPYPSPLDPDREPEGYRLRSPLPRLAWRYRSELAPISTALGLLVAGLVLHGFWPGWWQIVAATGLAAGLIVGDLGHRLGLDRAVERGYAALVTAAGGLWLAAATRLGPLRRPLLLVLLAGVLVGGVPWWTHRRRRAKVRVIRAMTTWAEDAAAADLDGAHLQAVDVTADGQQWTARLLLPKGKTLADALARVPKLESALGLRPRAIRVEEDPTLARRVILRVVTRDPHTRPLPMPELAGRPTITRPVLVAVFETGEPLRVNLLRKHALFGGATGSGKSTLLNAFLATLAPAPDVLLWGIDFAGGTALVPWQACFGRIATTPTDARALLEDACRVIEVRNRWLVHHGRDAWQPIPDAPALVLPVDELAELVEQLPDAATHLDSIARLGRKTAVTLLVATQRPTQDALGGGALRAQLTVRVCLRVTEPADGELILGRGKAKQGYRPDLLDAPGKLLVWDPPDHTRPVPAKAYTLDRGRIRQLVSGAYNPVPELDADSAAALAERDAPDQPPPERETALEGRTTPARPERSQVPDRPPAVIEDAGDGDPRAALWAALHAAGPRGAKVAELAHTVGRAKTWVYERLQDLHRQRQVERAGHGRWRPIPDPNAHDRHGPDDHHG
ncbi:MAG TPA: FtsK/SpoIIIE domain-containing protein [Actinomycetes bacterium]|jgi:S-DNA-T family DNA segregation ATPase FtsK/SpoIIIE